jgi:hypothetical protein
MEKRLLASSPDLESLVALIRKYFYSPSITVGKEPEYSISNSKGIIEGFLIERKKNRFRFYSIQN